MYMYLLLTAWAGYTCCIIIILTFNITSKAMNMHEMNNKFTGVVLESGLWYSQYGLTAVIKHSAVSQASRPHHSCHKSRNIVTV